MNTLPDIINIVKRLSDKLSNPGEEKSTMEVGWNDSIYGKIEELLKDVHPNIAKQIILNHL